jgi:Phage integrase family
LFPTITPHDLRHTAASLAISAGANVKAVQRMLGHAKASMTLDTYADLFDTDLDAVAVNLDGPSAPLPTLVGSRAGNGAAPISIHAGELSFAEIHATTRRRRTDSTRLARP